ncbi:MAG: hypothetical protein E7E72_09830 [Clostridium sp.]|nr:hypothetical protein [Clostridium sp.]
MKYMEINKSECTCSKCGYTFEELRDECLIICPHCKKIKKIQEFNLIEG